MGQSRKSDRSVRKRPDRKEILIGILVLIVGGILEYIDEVSLSGFSPSGPDVFPPWISQWDTSLLLSINPGLLNPVLNIVFSLITNLGSTFVIVVVCVTLYWLGYRNEAILVFASLLIGTVVLAPLKLIFNRPRPYTSQPKVIPLVNENGPSFPSGHSERVFALAAVFPTRRSLKVSLPYILAVAVAFSRVYVGVHYPFDVIIGSIIGIVVGKVTLRLQGGILKLTSRLAELLGLQRQSI
jgi:undecaprenyl-diphosphatase